MKRMKNMKKNRPEQMNSFVIQAVALNQTHPFGIFAFSGDVIS